MHRQGRSCAATCALVRPAVLRRRQDRGATQKVLCDREVALFSWCRMWGVPIAFVLAGGYLGPELERLVALPQDIDDS